MTGKAWIPFHFGSDNSRQECNYKGQGRLIFSNQANGSAYLPKIVYDANESGYRWVRGIDPPKGAFVAPFSFH